MSSDGYPENEYMMKCLTRIVYSAKAEIMPCAAGVLKQISAMLAKVCWHLHLPITHSVLTLAPPLAARSLTGCGEANEPVV